MDLLFSSLRAEPGRLLALPRRPGGVRGRQTTGSRAQVRALLASRWVAYVLCCSVGEKYLSDAREPSVLSCGAVLVRSVATLNRGDPIDPGMYACARVCSHA